MNDEEEIFSEIEEKLKEMKKILDEFRGKVRKRDWRRMKNEVSN